MARSGGSGAGPGTGRPALPDARRKVHKVTVRFTPGQFAELVRQADGAMLSLAEYVHRRAIGGGAAPRRVPALHLAAVGDLNRLGNNLNQLVRLLHQGRAPLGIQGAVEKLIALVETMLARLDEASEAGRAGGDGGR